jgi:type I restriction enzyme S subunit
MSQIKSLDTRVKFKDTPIGKIPVDWEVETLIDSIGGRNDQVVAGPFGSNLKVDNYQEEGVPIIRLQNVDNCKFINKDIKYISIQKADELSYHSFKKGDIVLAKLGLPIGKTCIIPDFIEDGIVVADVVRIRVDEQISDKKYFMYTLNSFYVSNQLNSGIIGTTRPRVNLNHVRNLLIPTPPLPEQHKIAEILSTVDEAIEKTDRIIEKTKELKKGLMQKLLARGIGHTKFKKTKIGKIPVDWEAVKLGDISDVKRGASPRPINDPKWFGGNVGWVRISDVTNSKKYLTKTKDYLSDEGVKRTIKIKKGEVILSICATIGRPIIVNMDACIHDGFVWFDHLSDKVNREFLYYFLQLNEQKLASSRQTGTQGNLNTSIISNMLITMPPKEEQHKIAEILSIVDSHVDKELEHKQKCEFLKKTLMHILLTGKIRVKLN